MRSLRILAAAALAAALFCCAPGQAAGAKGAAAELTQQCDFTASPSENSPDDLRDGRHDTAWTAEADEGQFIEIDTPASAPAAGFYIQWNCVPEKYSVLESSGGEVWSYANLEGRDGFINAWIPLSGQAKKIRIEPESAGWRMSVAEIRVFGQGEPPSDVQVWEPQPQKADLMVIPAHPDDELIYFGGTLPYYAGQLGKHTVVVYMTSSPIIRKFEALNGLWKVGVREYPVFLPLENKYSTAIEDAENDWGGLDHTVSLLVEQIRKYKPDVVVTHDLGGEYGHGAHKLTALATEIAVDDGNNPGKYADSAGLYGIWQVKKCYLHLYAENRIEMDWEEPLSAFGGKTALEMAREGYALHVSQHFNDRPIVDSGPYDNACFGLYYSSVGPDKSGGDFFENIPAEPEPTLMSTPSPTAKPSPTAGPSPTASPIPGTAPSDEPAAPAAARAYRPPAVSANTVVRILSGAVAVFALAYLAMEYLTTGKHAKKLLKKP